MDARQQMKFYLMNSEDIRTNRSFYFKREGFNKGRSTECRGLSKIKNRKISLPIGYY
jgi:extradiol dioxygenase family protein